MHDSCAPGTRACPAGTHMCSRVICTGNVPPGTARARRGTYMCTYVYARYPLGTTSRVPYVHICTGGCPHVFIRTGSVPAGHVPAGYRHVLICIGKVPAGHRAGFSESFADTIIIRYHLEMAQVGTIIRSLNIFPTEKVQLRTAGSRCGRAAVHGSRCKHSGMAPSHCCCLSPPSTGSSSTDTATAALDHLH